jgi:hypothetical protein
MKCRPYRDYPPAYTPKDRTEDDQNYRPKMSKKATAATASMLAATALLSNGGYLSPDINWKDDIDEIK